MKPTAATVASEMRATPAATGASNTAKAMSATRKISQAEATRERARASG